MRHEGEVAHKEFLFLHDIGFLVAQTGLDFQGRGVSGVAGLALLHVVARLLVHLVVDERQFEVALIVGNGSHVGEHFPETRFQKFPIGLLLNLEKVRHGNHFLIPREIHSGRVSVVFDFGHLPSTFPSLTVCLLFYASHSVAPRRSWKKAACPARGRVGAA